eukprot:298355_1
MSVLSDVNDSFEAIPDSDLSIYKVKPTKRSIVEKIEQEAKDIKYQKIWVAFHTIIFILIAFQTLYLCNKKVSQLSEFYDTQYQCCYCAWIARNGEFNDNKEIEYSHCKQEYNKAYNTPEICTINDTEYCLGNSINLLKRDRSVSTTSTILFIRFPKSYIYYGILGMVLVILYSLFVIIATFKYMIRLSSLLFVGNIVIAIQLYYNYIKAYQYTKFSYNAMCSNTPLPANGLYEQSCYENTVGRFTSTLLNIMVNFFMVYFVYPIVFYILSCFIKRCSYGYKCAVMQSYVERLLLYVGVIGGLISVVLCFIVLMLVVNRTDNNEFILNLAGERYLCIVIGVTLFITSISVFCLPHCRARCELMIRARNIPKWKDAILNDDEFDTLEEANERRSSIEQSVDMTEIKSNTMNTKPHSPLLE